MSLFTKMFGTYSEREIKKLKKTLSKIEDPERIDRYKKMSDDELKSQTLILKSRLEKGESLDDILPDAFCTVREADDRVLGKRPFHVQLIGGIVLHQGRVAEMKTGEGKTLVATLPAYLNALSGKSVHIVTVNEYLARMGAEEMGRVYEFLGLSTGLILSGQSTEEKRAAYNCDITYGTNNEFGFDYLRDNLVDDKRKRVGRDMSFAIIDEVDSILIDEARTPLIISGFKNQSNDLYIKADSIASRMKKKVMKEVDSKKNLDEISEGADYVVDEKARSAVLTTKGIDFAEKEFGIENLADENNSIIAHHINLAIRARGVMKRDIDYMVDEENNQVLIIDSFTGRIMPGRRYSDGLHQAIEAKEKVDVQNEDKTIATITLQNFFRLYKKLSGMTGTALTEAEEFREIYLLDVVEIPTNLPMIRLDHPDWVYRNVSGKYKAIVKQIKICHDKGQPVLIGTPSVEKSEEFHHILSKEGIKHEVLNAKNHKREAEIVAHAGERGAVTIATNMAGRGTDILLGGNPEFMAKQKMRSEGYSEEIIAVVAGTSVSVSDEVIEARKVYKELYEKFKEEIQPEYEYVKSVGGLFIIGTERHESRRVDNQFRGRSGRQGDPGESRFFVSFEDDLLRIYGGDRMNSMYGVLTARLNLDESDPVTAEGGFSPKILSNLIENCQKKLEDRNFKIRKSVLEYDDVINQQRKIIYEERNEVLDDADFHEKIVNMIKQTVEKAVDETCAGDDAELWDLDSLRSRLIGVLFKEDDLKYSEEEKKELRFDSFKDGIIEKALDKYAKKADTPEKEEFLKVIERSILLKCVDDNWIDHIDAMDDFKEGVQLQSFAQRNPITEYKITGQAMFEDMIENIRESTVRRLLSIELVDRREEERSGVTITQMGQGLRAAKRIGRKASPANMQRGVSVPSGDKREPVRKEKTPGPNDPCPCGSGLKYKKCCGAKSE